MTGTGAPDPQNAAHVGYLQLNHLSGYAGSAGWPDWELPFIEWAEREGFEIGVSRTPISRTTPRCSDGALRLYLSVGHDEYWSRGMRDTVEAFIAGGGNAAFFSGNTSLWQVRIEGDDRDRPYDGRLQGLLQERPADGHRPRARGDDVLVRRRRRPSREPHDRRLVHPRRLSPHRQQRDRTALGGYTVHRAGHWIFDGTGLGYGDVLGAGATVVGYECDGCVFTYRDGLPYPTGEDGTPSTFEILGTCPTQHFTRETAPRPPTPGEPSELEYIASRLFGDARPRGRWNASATATRCWARTRDRRAPRSSPRGRPTGPTGWPAATRRSSRSPGTSSTASAAAGVSTSSGVRGGLVGVVDAGEAGDLAGAGLGVEALGVALLAHLERRVDEHLDERQARGLVERPGRGRGRRGTG